MFCLFVCFYYCSFIHLFIKSLINLSFPFSHSFILILLVLFQLTGQPNLPTYSADCSSSGKAVLAGSNISLKLSDNHPVKLKAKIELQHHKEVEAIEKTIIVMPSRRARQIQVRLYKKPNNYEMSELIALKNKIMPLKTKHLSP